MTDEARDAAIGRTVTEYRDAKARLTALRGELSRTAAALTAVVAGLQSEPGLLDFGGDVSSMTAAGRVIRVDPQCLDRELLQAQVKDYRALKEQVERLAGHITEFGLTP